MFHYPEGHIKEGVCVCVWKFFFSMSDPLAKRIYVDVKHGVMLMVVQL